MSDQDLWLKLNQVFQSVFGRESIAVGPLTTAQDVEEWDSLNHVQLILSVEAAFALRFKTIEVAGFENVGDMMAAIKRTLGR